MNFNYALKVFQLNMLRQSGIAVTPQQVGLKSDPIADLQAKNSTSLFSSVLSQYGTTTTGLVPPVPPTPPADPTDSTAQAKYQQQLLTYQSNFQVYNQRFMQLLLSQLSNMQLSMRNAAQSGSSTSSSSSSTSTSDLGIGGILY